MTSSWVGLLKSVSDTYGSWSFFNYLCSCTQKANSLSFSKKLMRQWVQCFCLTAILNKSTICWYADSFDSKNKSVAPLTRWRHRWVIADSSKNSVKQKKTETHWSISFFQKSQTNYFFGYQHRQLENDQKWQISDTDFNRPPQLLIIAVGYYHYSVVGDKWWLECISLLRQAGV